MHSAHHKQWEMDAAEQRSSVSSSIGRSVCEHAVGGKDKLSQVTKEGCRVIGC